MRILVFLVLHLVALVGARPDRPWLSIAGYDPAELNSELGIAAAFDRWRISHSKEYRDPAEAKSRFEAFRSNLRYIDKHNSRGGTYWLGLNKFSDFTNEEFRSRFVGLNASSRTNLVPRHLDAEGLDDVEAPSSIDWRDQGAVTGVKDQGSCGGCWAFSTTGAIEGINKIKTKQLISLSEQELIDCDRKLDNGCEGGLMDYAFQFVIEAGGLDTEKDYPFRGVQSSCNRLKKNSPVVSIDSYADVPFNNELALLKAVARQPVSVAIEGASPDFQHYAGGVFTGDCGDKVNHGVLIVGYGSQDGLDYWIVKNSWGPYWGEAGYIRMQRNTGKSTGLCSINTLPSYPVKTGPNPTPAPAPPPAPKCNLFFHCPAGSTCCCTRKLGPFCLTWGCCGLESAVCCKDKIHCCPAEFPICSSGTGQCLERSSGTGIALLRKQPAQLSTSSIVTVVF